ncbi:MAG: pyridoxal phosphate-dependent aminotransferase [Gammaproteobacteria bacterium]
MKDRKAVNTARRMANIDPFHVMDILARAKQLEAEGISIIHMEIGEPDFVTPQPIIDAGISALSNGYTHYTAATGLPDLRNKISDYYEYHYGISVSSERIIITPGASGALQLILGVLINPGDQVLMADPGYPCNRHFVRMFEGEAIGIPVDHSTSYQLTAESVESNWTALTKGVLIASPSNPTGTIIHNEELINLNKVAERYNGHVIVDEIYHGLVYEHDISSALAYSEDVFVLNSFSKFFGMTGWRLGWLVAPEGYIDAIDRLAQNIFLAGSTPAQYAALAAFDKQTMEILEERRVEYKKRRDFLLPALKEVGFEIYSVPQGAFYIYANAEKFCEDSYSLALDLLNNAGVAVTPGRDFGTHLAGKHIRFAYTTALPKLEEGVARLKNYLG